MQRIIGLLKSSSTSISSSEPSPTSSPELEGSQPQQSPPVGCRSHSHMAPCLQSLPAEIIHTILSFLPPVSLAHVLQTSNQLRSHASNELLWMRLVKENVPPETPLPSPAPANSWRELYTAHHPYWFLTRNKIWFSDAAHLGGLVIARYDYRRGCIEAYPLVARAGWTKYMVESWEYNPAVRIHPFNPEINLLLDDPVIKLGLNRKAAKQPSSEVEMQTGRTPGISSMLSLCTAMPALRQDPRMSLWPPSSIPSSERIRNSSSSQFRSNAHRPKTLADASEYTFRLRKFLQWSSRLQPVEFMTMGESVSTFSTLLKESYTPTKTKPYQGIWVGDYSAHGCEFLLVMQKDHAPEVDTVRRASSDSGMLPSGILIKPREVSNDTNDKPVEEGSASSTDDEESSEDPAPTQESSQSYIPSGRIEAIKLTGDENVPRGECTWFADDIGDGALVRVGDEERFRGARIVRSMGQVAQSNFRNNRFIESQLILISHDTLAQYWQVSQSHPTSPSSGTSEHHEC